MLQKLNKLTNWQASLIIAVLGFAVYFDGLKNQFLGDDTGQILNNPVVESITHFKLFFEGGTFYNGGGIAPLGGVYFRPLMTTVFSLIYTAFGPHPIYFHLFQLFLCTGSAIILYLFFRYFFEPVLALFLSLVFLLHPINSQVVFAIASMQDALFFFFGILALYLLVRFRSGRSLFAVAVCLFLSLLAKETGVLFVVMAFVYLFWFDQRKRLYMFMGSMVLPVALYLVLKISAIGLVGTNPNNSPIDSLGLTGRLFTAPSIAWFYITKLIFPVNLAHAYYWVYPTFSYRHFLLPLIFDLATVALLLYLAFVLSKRASRAVYHGYVFFALWSVIGMLLTLQIIPVDMTACETWFYFSMAGAMGMIGMLVTAFGSSIRFDRRIVLAIIVIIIALFGVRTAIRGRDWSSLNTLALSDIKVSKDDFYSEMIIAIDFYNQGDIQRARLRAEQSVNIYPNGTNYETLGIINYRLGNYLESEHDDMSGLKYKDNAALKEQLYDSAAGIMVWSGDQKSSIQFIRQGVTAFPQDASLWLYLALLEYQNGNPVGAKTSIAQARSLSQSGSIDSSYQIIMNNEQLVINPSVNPIKFLKIN